MQESEEIRVGFIGFGRMAEGRARFENGCRATASNCDIAYVPWPKWIVLGTEGSIKHQQETLVRTADRACFEPHGVSSVNLHDNYFAHLREGAELLVKSDEGLRVMQVIDAALPPPSAADRST